LRREPTAEELAEELKLPINQVEEALTANQMQPISLNVRVGDDESAEFGDIVGTEITDTQNIISAEEQAEQALVGSAIHQAINQQLSDREKRIIKMRYGLGEEADPMTLEAISRELRITRERVRQIEKSALEKLAKNKKLEGLGPV
jgi:RNA polymerase sigma factor (sigma-70 family)